MKLQTKVLGSFGLIGAVIIAIGTFAVISVSSSSSSLQYIVGPAWDMADGAMETSIELEAEMLAVYDLLDGADKSGVMDRLKAANESAKEASARLIDAGLIGESRTAQLETLYAQYHEKRNALIDEYERYSQAKNSYDAATLALVGFGEKLEELGDSAVEELEASPDRLITWRKDIEPRWKAADGGMESNIGLLWKLYQTQRLLDGIDFESQLKLSRRLAHSSRRPMRRCSLRDGLTYLPAASG